MLTAMPRTLPSDRRNLIVVGISDCAASANRCASIITYALGSCVAVCLYDDASGAGALLHIFLPESQLNPEKAAQNPWMFADTAVPKLFEKFAAHGGDSRRAVVRIAGGAQVMDQNGTFNIGKRNYLAVKKMLWKAGIMIAGEAVGGEMSRTVRLDLANGSFYIREGGREELEMNSRVPTPRLELGRNGAIK